MNFEVLKFTVHVTTMLIQNLNITDHKNAQCIIITTVGMNS